MRKPLTALAVLCALAVAAPAASQAAPPQAHAAAPYLSCGEAKRAMGRQLRQGFEYGAQAGSLDTGPCYRRAINWVTFYGSFIDLDGDTWCGRFGVVETARFYNSRWNVSVC